jgi:hypothetical protein
LASGGTSLRVATTSGECWFFMGVVLVLALQGR